MSQRRKFQRVIGQRRYRKLFVIAAEGRVTEHQYFTIFNNDQSVIKVKCLKNKDQSAPLNLLKRMKEYLKEESLLNTDEAWLVIDKDQWTDDQLNQLYNWSLTQENYGFALSNPKFEYWILLHFEDGFGINNSRDCTERLNQYLPNYKKAVDIKKINSDMIQQAIRRAKERDKPPCTDWPRGIASTTVYRLIEKIIQSSSARERT